MEKTDVQRMIDDSIAEAMRFSTVKYGDTPMDSNQLCPKKYVDTVAGYIGIVNSNGTAGSIFPAGWSSVKNGTGDYTVTHSLGTAAYVVLLTDAGGTVSFFTVNSATTTTFQVLSYSSVSANADRKFYFTLIKD